MLARPCQPSPRPCVSRRALAACTAPAPLPPLAVEEAPTSAPPPSRTLCLRCLRALCLCSSLPDDGGARTRASFLVLQTRTERFNSLSTGRLVALGLARASLIVDDGSERLPCPAVLHPSAGLLFPGPTSAVLSPASASCPQLVVVDGTWHEAKRLVRNNAWLAALPRFSLPPGPPSAYVVRTQPAGHCVSTVEAVARAIVAMEGGGCDERTRRR